jgi:predicted flap endonuclease-1-like 5' DNA nuclease
VTASGGSIASGSAASGASAKAHPSKPKAAKKGGIAKKSSVPMKRKNNGLSDIDGIGPKTLEKLEAAGVKTPKDLAGAGVDLLAEKTGISAKKILTWQTAANAGS